MPDDEDLEEVIRHIPQRKLKVIKLGVGHVLKDISWTHGTPHPKDPLEKLRIARIRAARVRDIPRPSDVGAQCTVLNNFQHKSPFFVTPIDLRKFLQAERREWEDGYQYGPFFVSIFDIIGWTTDLEYVTYYEPKAQDTPDHIKVIDMEGNQILGSPDERTWNHFLSLFHYIPQEDDDGGKTRSLLF